MIWAVMALFFLALAFFWKWHFLSPEKREANVHVHLLAYVQEVRERIELFSDQMESDADVLAERLCREGSVNTNYSDLTLDSPFPYMVYQEGEPVFWSDFHYHFKLSKEQEEGWRLERQRNGLFWVYQKPISCGREECDIVFLLPLELQYDLENAYLHSGPNEKVFEGIDLKLTQYPQAGSEVISLREKVLLYLTLSSGQRLDQLLVNTWLLFLGLSWFSLGVWVWMVFYEWKKKKQPFWALCLLAVFLFGTRALMLATTFPIVFVDWELFNPVFYASSNIFPSFGDLLLNVLCLAIWLICFYQLLPSSYMYRSLKVIKGSQNVFWALALTIIGFASFMNTFWLLNSFYFNSQWDFDITSNIEWDRYKVVYFGVLGLVALMFFLVNHLVLKLLEALRQNNLKYITWILAPVSVCVGALNFFMDAEYFFLVFVYALFMGLSLQAGYYKELTRFRYRHYLYLLFYLIIFSLIGASAVEEHTWFRQRLEKRRFAEEVFAHNDLQGEYLLDEVSNQIAEDPFVRRIFYTPWNDGSLARDKIRRVYLGNYFEKYNVKVGLFGQDGYPLSGNGLEGSYADLRRKFAKEKWATSHKNLFFLNSYREDFQSRYYKFIPIVRHGMSLGYVVLELIPQKITANSVFPRLLRDSKLLDPSELARYNYGVYRNGGFEYSYGTFHYEEQGFLENLTAEVSEGLAWGHFREDNYLHELVKGPNQVWVVVSTPGNRWRVFSSNFSLLFLVMLFLTFVMVLSNQFVHRYYNRRMTFSLKIQIYLNIAYFLPLLIISLVTMKVVSSIYQKEVIFNFQQRAERLKGNLIPTLEAYGEDDLSKSSLRAELNRLARYSESDLNLYDTKGRLILSSQPLIYETHLMADLMNPKVLSEVFEQRKNFVLVNEKVGGFQFNAVYVRLMARDSGELLGVLSIPFFNSKEELKENEIRVLTTILNIFTAVFLLIFVLSFFSFKNLTNPLTIISDGLKQMTLGKNEKLFWEAEDEIGLLVDEYNRMLDKLEESKKALARTEKESAWQEMAKQVAHEIKNPLTPMKLKLQFLQRVIDGDDPKSQKIRDSLEALLVQVDALSDIATSFSSFAVMPIPEKERFNLTQVVRHVGSIYEDHKDMELSIEIPEEELYVVGDEKLTSGILTNLILNGMQAKSSEGLPQILLALRRVGEQTVQLEVKDDGDGIPENIRHKVFLPNFTTKFTGSGIGLALAKRGIENAEGKIWFETEEGVGTSFFIELPLAEKE